MSESFCPDVDALVGSIESGSRIAMLNDNAPATAAACALVRAGVRDLRLVGVPTLGLAGDILIGAGCVATVEGGGVTLGEYGQAPNFVRAVKSGAIRPIDTTCPAIYTALQAAEKGVPFMPMRGLLGSDILANHPDYRVIDNPFADADPVVAIPALHPDVALLHVPLADRHGNLWVGRHREMTIMAHAARRTLATCEAIHDGDIMEDEALSASALSGFHVDGVALAPYGARPLALPGRYPADAAALEAYVQAARSEAGMRAWLEAHVLSRPAAAE